MINSQMANRLWNDFEGHRKLHLASWKMICMKKEFGGLGIPNLQEVNTCLLGSWVKRFYEEGEKPWQAIIEEKYLSGKPNLFAVHSIPNSSRFWKGFQSIIQNLKFGFRWEVGNGERVRFWEDTWFGTSPLATQFWPVYPVCNEQTKTIKEV